MNLAFFSDDVDQFIVFQDAGEVVRMVSYPYNNVKWSYTTGSTKGSSPMTFFEDKIFLSTNGPPYYLIVLGMKHGNEIKKVEIESEGESGVFIDNANMYPKPTINKVTETVYYIANRGDTPGQITSVLYGFDLNLDQKWVLNLTIPYIFKCSDAVITNDFKNAVLYCEKRVPSENEDVSTTFLVILSDDGTVIRETDEVNGICSKIALHKDENILFLQCYDTNTHTIYQVDYSSGEVEKFVTEELIFDIITDSSGCIYFSTGSSEKWTRVNRRC